MQNMQNMQNNTIAYVNGEYLPLDKAQISPLDRGFIFGDGVYEVLWVLNGYIFYLEPHIQRLNQSLKQIGMEAPHSLEEWQAILNTLMEKNEQGNFSLYLQVTRGTYPIRKPEFPDITIPTVFIACFPHTPVSKAEFRKGFKARSVSDIRWKYCDIKTTARQAYVLMLQEVKKQGADEGIIIREGLALEGTASNFFIAKDGILMTPPKSDALLSGIVRDVVIALARKNNIQVLEQNISETDLEFADELWTTSSVRGIYPIVEYNGRTLGLGVPGPFWERIWDLYDEECNRLSLSIPH